MTSDCGLWFGWTDPLAVIYLWRCPLVFMLTVRCQRVFGIYLCRRCCDNDMMMTGRCCVCLKWKKIDEREDEGKSPGCTVFVKLTNTLRTSPSRLFWSHKTAELCHSFQFNFQWWFSNHKLQQSYNHVPPLFKLFFVTSDGELFAISSSSPSRLLSPWVPLIHKFLHHHICPITAPIFLKLIDCCMLLFKYHCDAAFQDRQ